MNQNTERLLNKVNDKLKTIPLFFFSREVERSLGLEKYLENYHIACIENHHIARKLKDYDSDVFVLSEHENVTEPSTISLIRNEKTQAWIKETTKGKAFYSQVFHANQQIEFELQKQGSVFFDNEAKINQKFENKLSSYKVLKENNINVPEGFIAESNTLAFEEIYKTLGKFVIQLNKGHTGTTTFMISTAEDFQNFQNLYNGTLVKVTKFIDAPTYTINACICKNKIFVQGLQYQITGIPELTDSKGTTLGNDWAYASQNISAVVKQKIVNEIEKIGELMKKDNYIGLFGIDLIVRNDEIYIIEINARQTANTPMQTKLELIADIVPLQLINLCAFLDIEDEYISNHKNNELIDLFGSQIFLRSKKDNFVVNHDIKSGIYRLQSDNSARAANDHKYFKEDVIFIDEEKDMPLIFQNEGYCVDDIHNGGFLILCQKKGTVKNRTDELCRMQFKQSIISNEKLAPWILQALKNVEEMVR